MRFFWATYMEHKVIFGFMVLVLFAAIGAGLVKLVTSAPASLPASKGTVVKTASSSPVTPASAHPAPVRTHHRRHHHVVLTPSPSHRTYAYSPSPAPAPTRSASPAPTRTVTITPTPTHTVTPAPTVTVTPPTPVVTTTPAGSPPAT